jgi:hypothetical protein
MKASIFSPVHHPVNPVLPMKKRLHDFACISILIVGAVGSFICILLEKLFRFGSKTNGNIKKKMDSAANKLHDEPLSLFLSIVLLSLCWLSCFSFFVTSAFQIFFRPVPASSAEMVINLVVHAIPPLLLLVPLQYFVRSGAQVIMNSDDDEYD